MAKKNSKSQKERLQDELINLIPDIDEEGLVFLIGQTHTLIHNQRSEKLNKEIDELNSKKEGNGEPKTNSGNTFSIEIEKAKNGKTFYFIVDGVKHFLDTQETQNIVALCYRPPTKSAALKYLHEFFKNERDEILMDHGINSPKSPFFEELFHTVRATFTFND